MERVVKLDDVHRIANIFLEDPVLVQNKVRFYFSINLPVGELYDTESRSLRSGSESYTFFSSCLQNWIAKFGDEATYSSLITTLRNENFNHVAELLSQRNRFADTSVCNDRTTIWFDVPAMVKNFTGRTAALDMLHASITNVNGCGATVITTISGLGGIGKTSLAVKYAWENVRIYENVIWVNSENVNSLEDSFIRMADSLNLLDTKSTPNELMKTIRTVYKYFSDKTCLFIFDNVDIEEELMRSYLPPVSSPYGKAPFVLLTSRNKKWSDTFQIIELNVFTESESCEFLTNYLNLQSETEKELAENLSQTLQRLPIAVRQAAAYITQQKNSSGKSNEACIIEYLSAFQSKSKDLLNFKTGDSFRKTTYLTWNVTLQKIKNNTLAVRIIRIISILRPDNIPLQIFSHLKKDALKNRFTRRIFGDKLVSQLLISAAIDILIQYSMLTENCGKLSVHRLVQTVIRDQLDKEQMKSKLRDSIEILGSSLKAMDTFTKPSLLHSESVLTHAKLYLPDIEYERFLKLVLLYGEKSVQIEIRKGDDLFQQGRYTEAIYVYQDAQKGLIENFGEVVRTKLLIKIKLGHAFKIVGNYPEALREYDDVINCADFPGYERMLSTNTNFHEELVMQLLQNRHEVLDNIGVNNSSPLFLKTARRLIKSEENGATALEILYCMSYVSKGCVLANLLENFYSKSLVESCTKTLEKYSLVRLQDDVIHVHIVIMVWNTLYRKRANAHNSLVKCLQILRASIAVRRTNMTDSFVSVWKHVLRSEQGIASEYSDVGVETCRRISPYSNDNKVITETVEILRRMSAHQTENILHIIYTTFNQIKSSGAPSLELAFKLGATIGLELYQQNNTRWSPMYIFFKEAQKLSNVATHALSDAKGYLLESVKTVEEETLNYHMECEIGQTDFTIDESCALGVGILGIVCKGTYDGSSVAIKSSRSSEKSDLLDILKELKICNYLGKHPNIVSLLGAHTKSISDGVLHIVLELCENGDLASYLSKMRTAGRHIQSEWNSNEVPSISNKQLVKWALQISSGMEYIEYKNVLHGDLAARNILLTSTLDAKISDFNLSRKLYQKTYTKRSKQPLPWRWMAPESLRKLEFSSKSDVWSYGITLWEVFTLGCVPFPGLNWSSDFSVQLFDGLRLHKPKLASEAIYSIMLSCWESIPSSRPSFSDIKTAIECIIDNAGDTDFLYSLDDRTTYQIENNAMYLDTDAFNTAASDGNSESD